MISATNKQLEKRNHNNLSYDEYIFVIDTIIESVGIEISRIIITDHAMKVSSTWFDFYYSMNIYTFFNLQSLKELSEKIFGDTVLRDFLFNLTERVSLSLVFDENDEIRLINTIKTSVCRNKKQSDSKSLILKEINESLYINPEVLDNLLKDNFWLLVIYLSSVYFYKSPVYEVMKANIK